MIEEIGTTAGEIWDYLEEHDKASPSKLIQELKKTERLVLMGIGWLAREGKLTIEKETQATYFMLESTYASDKSTSASDSEEHDG